MTEFFSQYLIIIVIRIHSRNVGRDLFDILLKIISNHDTRIISAKHPLIERISSAGES